MDVVMGLGSHLSLHPPGTDLRPEDLFSWSSAGHRNTTSTGARYFSINGGSTNIVGLSQVANGDFGDWSSAPCPQDHPYVQNAFACTGQSSDVAGILIGSNNNWQTTIIGGVITSNQVTAIQNSGYAPTAVSESAIIATLPPGNYTAIVRGVNNTVGVALVEVYDLNSDSDSVLGN